MLHTCQYSSSSFSPSQNDSLSTYLQKIMGRCSLLRIDLERKLQKVSEDWREIVLLFDRGRTVSRDEIQSTEWGFREVWRLSFDHLNGHDAK